MRTAGVWGAISALAALTVFSCAREERGAVVSSEFADEPEACALYEKMLGTARAAETMYYRCDYDCDLGVMKLESSYEVWMKKPGYARVEVESPDRTGKGILIGDGDYFWFYWTDERPMFAGEDVRKYEEVRTRSYMKKLAPGAQRSLARDFQRLGSMAMTPFEPSVFHGYPEIMNMYLDGVRKVGAELVGDEQCDVIEARFMDGQRSRFFWISREDHLPRKIREIAHLETDIVTQEIWEDVRINEDMSSDRFTWRPPQGWVLFTEPEAEDYLLKPGIEAPDFEATLSDGRLCRLSEFRGSVVWLVIYRVGCHGCRWELPHLEEIHNRHKNRGLVVLGFNFADKPTIATKFLEDLGVTFPNIIDTSEVARRVCLEKYQEPGLSMVPLNYLIGRDGRVISAWYGFDPDDGVEDLEDKLFKSVSLD